MPEPEGFYTINLRLCLKCSPYDVVCMRTQCPDSKVFDILLRAMGADIDKFEKHYSPGCVGRTVEQFYYNYNERGDYEFHSSSEKYMINLVESLEVLFMTTNDPDYCSGREYTLTPFGVRSKEEIDTLQAQVDQIMIEAQTPGFFGSGSHLGSYPETMSLSVSQPK